MWIFYSTDAELAAGADKHTIAVYSVSEVGIITRDYKGEETVHYGLETLEADNTDGGTTLFVRDDLVPETVEKEVTQEEINFSGGPISLIPGKGQAFSGVTIPVPDGLSPENIPEGMTIAGIVGARAAGKNIKVAGGKYTNEAPNGRAVINHGLGVIPDLFFVNSVTDTGGVKYIRHMVGISKVLHASLGLPYNITTWCTYEAATGSIYITLASTDFTKEGSEYLLCNADEQDIAVGNSTYLMLQGYSYTWLAIGGLA
jgi:hypothetical protein